MVVDVEAPAAPGGGTRTRDPFSAAFRARVGFALASGVLLGLVFALGAYGSRLPPDDPRALVYLTLRSLLRMVVAFGLSLAFSIVYGFSAATYPRAARVLLPVLDVLQSVPILGFFPVALLFFVSLFHGGILGLEAASVFLVFTSQSWNMTFGVYEALSALPQETRDAADVLGLRGRVRWRRLVLPALVPKLIYNGIVSWAGGWYFVTASEIITAAGTPITLPGLGSFLVHAAEAGDPSAIVAGLTALVGTVLAIEFLVWRPLQVWSERFKFESFHGARQPRSRLLGFYRTVFVPPPRPTVAAAMPAPEATASHRLPPETLAWTRRTIASAFLVLFGLAAWLLARALVHAFMGPVPPDARLVPAALLASTLRLGVAYLVTVAWTVPVAIYVVRRERASRIIVPLTEVLASVPAIALFPVIVLALVRWPGGLEAASVLVILTGMQWYLLFNLLASARQIPGDLVAAAEVLGLKGWRLWRRVYLPAMMPGFVTGSITAWGGGWNALIVSEYVRFGGETYHVFGIGNLIDRATFDAAEPTLLLLSVVGMVAYVYLLNRIVWKPLYRRAFRKYRLEG